MFDLILIHSYLRWLVLLSIVWGIFRAFKGWQLKDTFRRSDHILVRSVSGLSQLQLLLGFAVYFWSPVAQGFWVNRSFEWNDSLFFGIVHFVLMTIAIILISIGSALVKTVAEDNQKFKLLFLYFSIALLIILVAIPWPFSPLAQRPYLP
ncbi:MAG: hypothetical protein Q7T20_19035 [Saprospiraceae bacterium]|nr:hypothetical protein [Saprospiraceae bacterium]